MIATLALSVSLKQMWNLFNVIQVLNYFRSFSVWPALIDNIITYIIDAIYLKELNKTIMNIGQSEFEQVKS